MQATEYTKYDATGLADLVRQRQISAGELLAAALAAIEEREPALGAVVDRLDQSARAEVERGLSAGPFTGVPFMVKALGLQAASVPCAMGSRLAVGLVSPADSELTARYRRAGMVLVATTNTPELGLAFTTEPALTGPTRNPWDPRRTAGGSSGGSAAAVAAGLLPVAHGSDAAGSLRIPAAYCGVFGLKPSRGRQPAGPFLGEPLFGLATDHVLTRSVRDSAALLDATAGPDVGAPYAALGRSTSFVEQLGFAPGTLRIGVIERQEDHPACRAAVRQAAALCERLGHAVTPTAVPVSAEQIHATCTALFGVFAAQGVGQIAALLGRTPSAENLEPATLTLVGHGRGLTAVELGAALAGRDVIGRAIGRWMIDFDMVLSATTAAPAPPLGELALNEPGLGAAAIIERCLRAAPHPVLANLSGHPAMSVPLSAADGLPVGIHFLGPAGGEARLLRLASQLEQAAPWTLPAPPHA